MKIKHWQGYGSVTAKRVPDKNCTLHIRVEGNHEWGIVREDMYDLFNWLIKKFDKTFDSYTEFSRTYPTVNIISGYTDGENGYVEFCDYLFNYRKEK